MTAMLMVALVAMLMVLGMTELMVLTLVLTMLAIVLMIALMMWIMILMILALIKWITMTWAMMMDHVDGNNVDGDEDLDVDVHDFAGGVEGDVGDREVTLILAILPIMLLMTITVAMVIWTMVALMMMLLKMRLIP